MTEIEDGGEQLQMDFEGVEAQDSDVDSMSRLLNQAVRESGVDPTQLAKVLVSQNYIGSVLKPALDDVDFDDNEDPEDQAVYAITSIVNLTQRQEPVIQDIIKFLRKSVVESKLKVEKGTKIFEQLINENGMSGNVTLGLLVKERMVNMPVELLHPSLLSLLSDVERAIDKKMPYKFTHLMYWSKLYKDGDTFVHFDVEDAWFDLNAIDYFSYPLKHSDTVMVSSDSSAPGATPYRRVYIVDHSKLESFIEHLKENVGQ